MDHLADIQFNSLLGKELTRIQKQNLIDPSRLKRMLQEDIDRNSERLHAENILTGQQCARDLLIILSENKASWFDVYQAFHHVTVQTLRCPFCNRESVYRSSELYRELSCPPNNSRLRNYIEQILIKRFVTTRGGRGREICRDKTRKHEKLFYQTFITINDKV